MLEWYADDDLKIEFDRIPLVGIRYALPSMTDEEKKDVLKYPFINRHELRVRITYHDEVYEFIIEKGFTYDGMSIPRVVWSLIGVSKESPGGLIASLLHDYMCNNKYIVDNNRALSTNVFAALLKQGGTKPIRCFFMKNSVAFYQTLFCKWRKGK